MIYCMYSDVLFYERESPGIGLSRGHRESVVVPLGRKRLVRDLQGPCGGQAVDTLW